jgi:hypothetical protein
MGYEVGPVVRCDKEGCRAALPLVDGENPFDIVCKEPGWAWSSAVGYLCPIHAIVWRITAPHAEWRVDDIPR